MTIPKLSQHHLNLIASWIGAIATLSILVFRSPSPMHYAGIPTDLTLATIAALILLTILRFKPTKEATLALSGGLGAAFSALSYCLIQ